MVRVISLRAWQTFHTLWPGVTRTMEKLLTSPEVRELSRKAGEEVETAPTSFGLAFHVQWP